MIRLIWLMLAFSLACPIYVSARDRLTDEEKAWLDSVDPIITPEERKQFRRRLKAGQERLEFIELFWAKRDEDLYDGRNLFRENYLARYDYVMANFESTRSKLPTQDRSVIYLVLGKPDSVEYRIDITIMGPRFRNQFFQYRPEVWVYESLEMDYPRDRLKVQFVPSNTFGDYAAFTDNYTVIWLRKLKYNLIYHPEMTVVPSDIVAERDYQEQAIIGGNAAIDETLVDTSVNAPSEAESVETEIAPEADSASVEAPDSPDIARDTVSKPPKSNTDAAPPADTGEQLTVPTATTEVTEPAEPLTFQNDLPNILGLVGNLGYFRAADGRNLVLGRVGFPLRDLEFHFNEGQFEAPVEFQFDLLDSNDRVLYQKSEIQGLLIPREDAKMRAVFSDDFALILPTDRYTLRAQIKDMNAGESAYFEETFEIRPSRGENVVITDMALLDPNVATSEARLNLASRPYALRLNGDYTVGDTIYPVIEITPNVSQKAIDGILLLIFDGEDVAATYQLYPEEISVSNRGTKLIHPSIETTDLNPGEYLLRFEIELDSGTILISDVPITLEARAFRRP